MDTLKENFLKPLPNWKKIGLHHWLFLKSTYNKTENQLTRILTKQRYSLSKDVFTEYTRHFDFGSRSRLSNQHAPEFFPQTSDWGLTLLMWYALLEEYWILNFSCKASISSLTRWISWVWYSRMAPRMWGRTKSALNREKMRNISLAFLAVPRRSRRRAVMRVSTRSIRSSYRFEAASQTSTPSLETSKQSTSFTIS